MQDKLLGAVGLARRAGCTVLSYDLIYKSIIKKKIKLVILAADSSQNTKKKYRDKCKTYGVPILEYATKELLGSAVGKEFAAAVGVTDDNFVKLISTYVSESRGGPNDES